MDKDLLKLLGEKRAAEYSDPNSVLKEFDAFLESNGIYHSLNQSIFFKHIDGKTALAEFTLHMYSKATLDNERLFLLDCLLHMGYDKCKLAEMVLRVFRSEKENLCLWDYADFLYSIKVYSLLNDYISLIMDRSYGSARQMLVLLVGESKSPLVVPYLLELVREDEILGHVLIALSHFTDSRILPIMEANTHNKTKWIAKVASDYVKKH